MSKKWVIHPFNHSSDICVKCHRFRDLHDGDTCPVYVIAENGYPMSIISGEVDKQDVLKYLDNLREKYPHATYTLSRHKVITLAEVLEEPKVNQSLLHQLISKIRHKKESKL